jgi:hypothetical protein
MNFPFLAAAVLLLMAGGMTSGEDRVEHFADGTKDLVYSDTVLTEEISYDADGALKKETFFDSSSLPVRTRSYIREGGRLERVEYADAAGKLVGTQSYRYDRDGRLLGVDSDGDLGTISVGMISSGAIPQASWIAGKSTTVLAYDESGRVTMVQTMKDGAAVSVERRSYGDKGRLYSVQTEDKASGLVRNALRRGWQDVLEDRHSVEGTAGQDPIQLRRRGEAGRGDHAPRRASKRKENDVFRKRHVDERRDS